MPVEKLAEYVRSEEKYICWSCSALLPEGTTCRECHAPTIPEKPVVREVLPFCGSDDSEANTDPKAPFVERCCACKTSHSWINREHWISGPCPSCGATETPIPMVYSEPHAVEFKILTNFHPQKFTEKAANFNIDSSVSRIANKYFSENNIHKYPKEISTSDSPSCSV